MSFTEEMRRLAMRFEADQERRTASLAGIRADVARERAQYREEQRIRAAEGIGGIKAYVDRLREDTAAMRRRQADAHAQRNAEEGGRRRAYVANLRREVWGRMESLGRTRQIEGEALRQGLSQAVGGLAGEVETLRQEVAARRGALQADLAGAREIWHRFSATARGHAEAPAAPEAQAPAAPEVPVADDLTAIRGVGPAMAARLVEAGVVSFQQLAELTPDNVRLLLGDSGRLANIEDWIEQARALAAAG